MKFWRAVPAGLVDSGFASVATFVLNLYAIATWQGESADTLGVYFLYMTAFLMASTVPNQLLYIPAEKMTLEVGAEARTSFFGPIARLGFPAALGSVLLLLLATAVGVSQGIAVSDQVPFLITAGVATVFSPLQNHARRLLHLGGRNWAAASVSVVQALTAGAALLVLVRTSLGSEWIPIGALAVANVVSVATAAVLAARFARDLDERQRDAVAAVRNTMGYRHLIPSGRWLVATGVVSLGNNFLVESAVFVLASPAALALAGAAKTVAQPILVLANGLRSVLGPPSMEAAKAFNRQAAAKVARGFSLLIVGAVVGYIALAGFDWVGNPLARLVDSAYTVPLLVALSIAANGLNGAAFPGRLELIGAGREKQLFSADLLANIGQLVLAVTIAAIAGSSADTGSFARPVAFATLGLGRIFGYRRHLDRHYAQPPESGSQQTTIARSSDPLPPPA